MYNPTTLKMVHDTQLADRIADAHKERLARVALSGKRQYFGSRVSDLLIRLVSRSGNEEFGSTVLTDSPAT